MTSVETFLIAVAAILVLGSIGERVFVLTNIPDALWLLAAGIAIGPLLGIVRPDQLTMVAPYLGAVTIIVILFDGGARLDIATSLRTVPRATLLAFTGFVIATLIVCLASMAAAAAEVLPQPWSWQHGLLLGTILGGSSSVVVMPAVFRANLGPRVSGLVSFESALTDVLCIVGASTIVELMVLGATGASPDPVGGVVRTFGLGIVGGLVGGVLGLVALRYLRGSEYTYPLLLAGLMALYVAVDANGGSAPLAVLVFALIVANAHLPGFTGAEEWPGSLGPTVRGLHGMIAFIVKAFFFVFMGAMLGSPSLEMAFGAVLGGLLLVGRILAVRLATAGAGLTPTDRCIVSALLPRGLAAGVLAGLPVYAGVSGSAPIPSITYTAVLTTVLIFTVAFPLARRGEGDLPADGTDHGSARDVAGG
ncbi:MAG: cation:proton antiporter [Candidatus Limnocylindrales bacterium]|jgi:cell volume regulation protein A